jgi:hypothetical protein
VVLQPLAVGLEWATTLPSWVLAGLSLGLVFAAFSAAMFVVGEQLFPSPPGRRSDEAERGQARRHAEIRHYLDDIGERYAEEHPVAGHTVAFYLPERDVAVTFDAQAFFDIQGRGIDAVLCEHEMPGHHLGRRLPFEVPELEWEPASEPDAVERAFRALGLSPAASTDEVRDAYRERVMEVHPDHGGDEEAFREVRDAYTTAKEHAD